MNWIKKIFSKTASCDCKDAHYGEVKNGYQYCDKCGKAIPAPPVVKDTTCCTQHKWKMIEELPIVNSRTELTVACTYVSQCENCGIIKKDKISVNDKD